MAGMARCGLVWLGGVWLGTVRQARHGLDGYGAVSMVRQAWLG
jgi:hypothetical protein